MSNKTDLNPIVLEYVQETSSKDEREELKNKFKNVLEDWAKNNVSMGIYRKYDYVIHDMVIFNESKDKALLFSSYIKEPGRGTVDLFGAQFNRDEGVWYFHHRGLPGFAYRFKEDYLKDHEFSSDELLARSVDKLVDDGLVKFNKVSQKYINNKWFH